jgi:hypothetical protein
MARKKTVWRNTNHPWKILSQPAGAIFRRGASLNKDDVALILRCGGFPVSTWIAHSRGGILTHYRVAQTPLGLYYLQPTDSTGAPVSTVAQLWPAGTEANPVLVPKELSQQCMQ